MKIDIRDVICKLNNKTHVEVLKNSDVPVLILGDGVNYSPWHKDTIEVPNNTDAVYLGIDHKQNDEYFAQDITEPGGEWLARIQGVGCSYAVLYLTDRYKQQVLEVANQYEDFDMACASIQKDFNVVTPHLPFFYREEDERTLTPLPMAAYGAGVLGPGFGKGPKGV